MTQNAKFVIGLMGKLAEAERQRDELAAITCALMRFAVAPDNDEYDTYTEWLTAYGQFDETWNKALAVLDQEKA